MFADASWKPAPAPFDHKLGTTAVCNADAILRTSDNVYFYVHQAVLAIASPIFADMFVNPPGQDGSMTDGLFVLNVDEDSFTLNCVLRYCYPVRPAILPTLDAVDCVLRAARKYGLEEAARLIRQSLRGHANKWPLKTFAISCRYAYREEALLAAQAWKKTQRQWTFLADNFRDTAGALCYSPVLSSLPSIMYYRLTKYVVTNELPEDAFYAPLSPPPLERSPNPDTYPFNQGATDVVLMSTDGVAFPVHRNVIELHIAANPQRPRATLLTPVEEGSRIQTTEPSAVLFQLLRLCYPPSLGDRTSQITDTNCCSRRMVAAVSAAYDYGMHSIVDSYKRHLRRKIPQDAFAVYTISLRFNWHAEAHDAAVFMARHAMLPQIRSAWMDIMPTKQYYDLLRFWYRCQDAIFSTVQKFMPQMTRLQWKRDWYRSLPRDDQRVWAVVVEQEMKKKASVDGVDPGFDFMALCEESQELEVKIAEQLDAVIFCVG